MRKGSSLRRHVAASIALVAMLAPIVASSTEPGPIIVAVRATPAEAAVLDRSFDLVEMRDGAEVHVVLWPGDGDRLRAQGFTWRVVADDLIAEHLRASAPDPDAPQLAVPTTEIERSTYRTLAEHHAELRALATSYPQFVELLDIGRSLEGREIIGIRIAIGDADDGRPHAYIDGLHHAREWPSAEYVTGFAHRLVSDALAGDARVTDLLTRSAVILIPVMNPDGFTISRSFPVELSVVSYGAYWRKNARGVLNDAERGVTLGAYGVDPNRNYPFGWGNGDLLGGNGASNNPAGETYEGTAPASEPEVAAVRQVILQRNVTAVITNHTYGNLILYPWGHTSGPSPDAATFVPLAQHLAAANYYRPQPGIALYATTGTMEDWAYAATGTLGFTFEHGTSFHPIYGAVMLKRAWNEEAFLRLVEAAADPSKHSVLSGKVVDASGVGIRSTLTLTKTADVTLESGTSPERIELTLRTARDGTFTWHLNPSDGPIDTDDYRLTVTSAIAKPSRLVRLARGGSLHIPALRIS